LSCFVYIGLRSRLRVNIYGLCL